MVGFSLTLLTNFVIASEAKQSHIGFRLLAVSTLLDGRVVRAPSDVEVPKQAEIKIADLDFRSFQNFGSPFLWHVTSPVVPSLPRRTQVIPP